MKAYALLAALLLCWMSAPVQGRELKDTVIKAPAQGTPEWVILETLKKGVSDDFDGWYGTLCHPDYCLDTTLNKREFTKYTWPRFLKFVSSYFTDSSQTAFKVVYTQPATISDSDTSVKFFLFSSKRDNPTPIQLRKDKDGKWKVSNLSL
jgi:hypothetical protein